MVLLLKGKSGNGNIIFLGLVTFKAKLMWLFFEVQNLGSNWNYNLSHVFPCQNCYNNNYACKIQIGPSFTSGVRFCGPHNIISMGRM